MSAIERFVGSAPLSVDIGDGEVVLALHGDLDVSTEPQVAAALAKAFAATGDDRPRVVLDLTHLDFLDSRGIDLIRRALELAGRSSAEVVVRSPSWSVHRLLEIANLTDMVEGKTPPVRRPAPATHLCDIAVHELQGNWVIAVSGELDLAAVSQLRAELEWAEDARRCVVLDLRGVTFIDSTALRAILDADAASRNTPRRLVIDPSTAVRKLIALAGAGQELGIVGEADVKLPVRSLRVLSAPTTPIALSAPPPQATASGAP